MSEQTKIPIVVLVGSVRPGNFTSMAAAIVADELVKDENVSVEIIDPAELDLPLPGVSSSSDDGERLRERVARAEGIVLATPEYHGSYSSVMKLIIDNLGFPSVLAGKPVSLVGVAAGAIGAIKALEHLRSVCSHVGAIVLPNPVSVAGVHTVLAEDAGGTDEAVEERIRGAATSLMDYLHQNVCPRLALERIAPKEAS